MALSKVKVAAIQMDIALGNPPVNRAKAFKLVEEAVRQQAKIILLPELWTTVLPGTDPPAGRDRDGAFY